MGEFLLYPIIFAAVGWTARLAKSRGKNPWIWGCASVLLSVLHVPQTALLSLVPALVLLFVKLPATAVADQENRLACARCAKPHSDGQHFCTGCGWDLSESYSPEITEEGQPFATPPPVQTTMPSTSVAQPVETPEAQPSAPPVVETEIAAEAPVDETPVEASSEPAQAEEAQADGAEGEPATPYIPWGTYDPGVAPTAALMVSRGMERFEEKKYQEAIDQFTKAISLDPNYAEAWERRAESFAQMGRSDRAEDDRRHLKGLDPSSSTG